MLDQLVPNDRTAVPAAGIVVADMSGVGLAVAEDDQGSPAVAGEDRARPDVERDEHGRVRQAYHLDQDSAEPLHLQLARHLRDRILSGQLSGRLNSERVMAARYGVARGTVRQALTVLTEEGLVRQWQGRGTFTVPAAGRRGG
jgi:DNA-binding transcriptional ArsR family regulator